MQPFKSDGCTGIPDLWFGICCEAHDYAHYITGEEAGDLGFLLCVFLMTLIVAALFSISLFIGLKIFRPLYRKYQNKKEKINDN
jgi:hypothetical protein